MQRKGCGERIVLTEVELSIAVAYPRGFPCWYTILDAQIKDIQM